MQKDASTILKSPLPAIMAILNVTPDSFSDGGLCVTPETAANRARQLAEEGAFDKPAETPNIMRIE